MAVALTMEDLDARAGTFMHFQSFQSRHFCEQSPRFVSP